MRLVRLSVFWRGLFALTALLVFLVRLAVPTGYMPTAIGGTVLIQLCSGQHSITLDLGKKVPKEAHGPCAFSGGFAGNLLAPGVADKALAPPLSVLLLAPAVIAHLVVHRLAAPPPPAIGPPARA